MKVGTKLKHERVYGNVMARRDDGKYLVWWSDGDATNEWPEWWSEHEVVSDATYQRAMRRLAKEQTT